MVLILFGIITIFVCIYRKEPFGVTGHWGGFGGGLGGWSLTPAMVAIVITLFCTLLLVFPYGLRTYLEILQLQQKMAEKKKDGGEESKSEKVSVNITGSQQQTTDSKATSQAAVKSKTRDTVGRDAGIVDKGGK